MPNNAIGRRIERCCHHLQNGEIEDAAIHLFPAIDATAKLRRPPPIGVGQRIKRFITDEERIITLIAFRMSITGCEFNGQTIADAVYEYARNPLMHEGQLDPRMTFQAIQGFSLGGAWNLPPTFLFALAVAVIIAPENKGVRIHDDIKARILNQNYNVNDIWGQRQHFVDLIDRSS